MNEPALAIDFGTSRTKVAWRDADGAVHLLHFDGVPYLPSLFYLPSGSDDILFGHDAHDALEDDPLSVIAELKRAIERNTTIRVTKDRHTDPQTLWLELFKTIKQRSLEEITAFNGLSPEQVWLTVPGNASETMETLLKRAARAVGWDMAQVVHEPVAAARHWLYEEGHSEAPEAMVVVLDVGGGTTDWALLQRTGNRIHRAEQFVPGAVSVGGTDVDRALSDWVRDRHPELFTVWPEPRLRHRLRTWKEAMLGGENPAPIRIKGQLLGLDEVELGQQFKKVLLDKVLPSFKTFLKPIVEQHPNVPVLLVGGSATGLLEKAVKEIHPLVHRSQDSVGAVIRGALVTAARREIKQEPPIEDSSVQPRQEELVEKVPEPKKYAIGDEGPAGGIVFYVDESGLHGLEMQPANADVGGTNKSNYLGKFYTFDEAMTVDKSYGPGWHLPTKDELNQIWLFLQDSEFFKLGFDYSYYWSSTKCETYSDGSYSWIQIFANGNQHHFCKNNELKRVRAVRGF